MDRYMDLTILPDPEFPSALLMNALFIKFHRCLVRLKATDIGISFPEVNEQAPHFGRILRLHSSDEGFGRLMGEPWLTGMRDHIRFGAAETVPQEAGHWRVRRAQAKSSPERLRRRQMRRHGLTEAQARARVPESAQRMLDLPYLTLDSRSTSQRFRLFLRHEAVDVAVAGEFNAFGLSQTATVPRF